MRLVITCFFLGLLSFVAAVPVESNPKLDVQPPADALQSRVRPIQYSFHTFNPSLSDSNDEDYAKAKSMVAEFLEISKLMINGQHLAEPKQRFRGSKLDLMTEVTVNIEGDLNGRTGLVAVMKRCSGRVSGILFSKNLPFIAIKKGELLPDSETAKASTGALRDWY
ncbi:hypothetical protein J3R30DRAFT_3402443 [Lentinula aciculospora]|uniref:Uncharacterized protein n=1 Tax=Lentinula aciculospora TaxID=153920 RepID=A0A9W9AIW8_9AGAR|nr:hypothetical protein J3R30DRAFT_3402443 [Lentinula aciculospora]